RLTHPTTHNTHHLIISPLCPPVSQSAIKGAPFTSPLPSSPPRYTTLPYTTLPYTHISIHKQTHTHRNKDTHTHIPQYILTHTHIYTHTHTHTHTQRDIVRR